MDADFAPLVVETHGRFHGDCVALLRRLARQLDGYHGLTAREMSVLLNGFGQGKCSACCQSKVPGLEGLAQEQAEGRAAQRSGEPSWQRMVR